MNNCYTRPRFTENHAYIRCFSGGYLDTLLFIKLKVFARFIYDCETEKGAIWILFESNGN